MVYDSTGDTLRHSLRVGELMVQAINELSQRSVAHDLSKTQPPEVGYFNEYTPRLREMEYGSDEYRQCLADMKPALDHHYANNRHHPERFENGVNDMTLVDLIEMLADWKAAGERNKNGSLEKSLVIQKDRFGLSDQLLGVLENTARHFDWL
jgi:hypothetical protein